MVIERPLHKESTEEPSQKIYWSEALQRLEIDWTESLGYPCKLVVNSWENGMEWWSELEDETYHPIPFVEPGVNFLAKTDNPAIKQWQSTVPEHLLHALRPFDLWSFSLLQLTVQNSCTKKISMSFWSYWGVHGKP